MGTAEKVTVNIVSRWDDSKILFSAEVDASIEERFRLRVALEMGVKAGANLADANLARANLAGAKISPDRTLIGDRPLLQIGTIGSCSRIFHAYITDKGLMLRAGCFFGTRDEFLASLKETHGDNKHAREYKAALALIDVHAKLWTPKSEQEVAA